MRQRYTVIVLSLLIALLLSIMPMPGWTVWLRPKWVALVLIYWVMARPDKVGIGSAFLVGLLQDLLEGVPLGQNALALSIIAYCVLSLYQRLRLFKLWQQAAFVGLLLVIEQLVAIWVQTLTRTTHLSWYWLLTCAVSILLWPAVFFVLRWLRRWSVGVYYHQQKD